MAHVLVEEDRRPAPGINDAAVRLARLAAMGPGAARMLSVYLDTRWADEHQRQRVRLFLEHEIRAARATPEGARLAADLDWIAEQGRRLVAQESARGARGVALFACASRGVREVFRVEVPFGPRFVVSDAPFVTPLAAAVEDVPESLVVFVDGRSARLIPFGVEGTDEGVTLESEVPGHHRRGGWSLLAQSRYQRHVREHRGRHFEAVAGTVAHIVESRPVTRIVVAGTPRNAAAFRTHLPPALAARVVGPVPASSHEADSVIAERATRLSLVLGTGAARVGGKPTAASGRPLIVRRKSRRSTKGKST